jgi:predicted dehydrogenase
MPSLVQYGGKACRSTDELLASDIDAIYIATLPDTHAHYTIKAFNAGKPFCAKNPPP